MYAMLMLLFVFCFGGLMLIIFLAATKIEETVVEMERDTTRLGADAAGIPRFFAVTHASGADAGKVDEEFVGRLREYVESEQSLADAFVSQPSIESLYRETAPRVTVH